MNATRKLAAIILTAGAVFLARSAYAGFPFFDNFFGGDDDDYYDRYGRYGYGGPYGYGDPYGYGGPYGWGGGPYGYGWGSPYGWGGGPYGYGGYGAQQTQSEPAPPPVPE